MTNVQIVRKIYPLSNTIVSRSKFRIVKYWTAYKLDIESGLNIPEFDRVGVEIAFCLFTVRRSKFAYTSCSIQFTI